MRDTALVSHRSNRCHMTRRIARPPLRGGDRTEGDGGQDVGRLGNRGLRQGEENEHNDVFLCDMRDRALTSHSSDDRRCRRTGSVTIQGDGTDGDCVQSSDRHESRGLR